VATKKTQEINRTLGEEAEVPCSKCDGKTYHKVLLSIDEEGEDDEGAFYFRWYSHHQIIQCQGCKTISFRRTSATSEDLEEFEDLYPSRVEGRKGLKDEVHFLPSRVRRIYTETLQALNSKSPILAGIGLRALVETVCHEKSAQGRNLLKKIDDLVAKAVLAPADAQFLHKIRTLGNSAAHKVEPHDEKSLGLAMDIIEHLLTGVYIFPEQVVGVLK